MSFIMAISLSTWNFRENKLVFDGNLSMWTTNRVVRLGLIFTLNFWISKKKFKILDPKILLQIWSPKAFQNLDSKIWNPNQMALTFSSTDSESFSRFMILMATFWLVTQWTPSLTSPVIERKLERFWNDPGGFRWKVHWRNDDEAARF